MWPVWARDLSPILHEPWLQAPRRDQRAAEAPTELQPGASFGKREGRVGKSGPTSSLCSYIGYRSELPTNECAGWWHNVTSGVQNSTATTPKRGPFSGTPPQRSGSARQATKRRIWGPFSQWGPKSRKLTPVCAKSAHLGSIFRMTTKVPLGS